MPAANESGILALDVRDVSKSYPGVLALNGVSFSLKAGEVHGLVGENGAGKSTLMKVIAGAVKQDRGSVEVWGEELSGGDPRRASAAGVGMIYQELTIVPDLSALSNAFLGRLPSRLGVVDAPAARRAFAEIAEVVGLAAAPGERAGDLSTANQQLIEIMRALISKKRLVIMDEPTASLGPEDSARLHAVIRQMRASGIAIVYVSHDLDHVLEICDTVTVLREGRVIESRAATAWTKSSLIASMLGGVKLADVAPRSGRVLPGEPLFTVENLSAPGVDLPHLDIRAGEIIGVAGLVGSGRTRPLRALAGADPVRSGRLRRGGATIAWPRSPRHALGLGMALAPEDRKGQGLVLDRASAWNIALGQFGRAAAGSPITGRRLAHWAERVARTVGFAPGRLTAQARVLSGGNQQKLLLARWLSRPVRCLLLDEPTRGIDIGAKAQIFETARSIVADGRAVIWSSSDLDEVVTHSDRVLVVARGRVVAELPAGCSVHEVLEIAFSATGEQRDEVAA